MMADQLFNDSSTVGSTAEIPDIFDVLEGGEDEGAVRYLLGFNGDEGGVGLLSQVETFGGMEVMDKYVGDGINLGLTTTYLPAITASSVVAATTPVKSAVTAIRHVHSAFNNKKRDTSGAKAIHSCDSCGKSFTTKFNLKRHINMHCHKSKENGVPIQGPPSASAPAKKNEKCIVQNKTVVERHITTLQTSSVKTESGGGHQITLTAAAGATSPPTVVNAPTIIHGTVPYSRVVTVPHTEYQQQPDSTYKLPSVQTILPVSTTVQYSSSSQPTLAAGVTTLSTISASCDSSQTTVSSVTSSSHNTDFGTLPADLFDPDSSRSEPPTPTSPTGRFIMEADPDEDMSQVTLTSIPAGWTRRLSGETGKVSYWSPLGKVFTSHEEIVQYFKTFNLMVPLGLFKFNPNYVQDSEDEDEDDSEDDEEDLEDSDEDESESICAKRRRSDVMFQYKEVGGTPASPGTYSSPPLA